MDTNQILENEFASMWMEDGIIFSLFKKGAVIGLEAAKECLLMRKKLSNNNNTPIVVFIKHLKVVSKEARMYFAEEGAVGITKGALITDSGFSKILGNIFLTLDKPKVPVRLFTNTEEAVVWLKKKDL